MPSVKLTHVDKEHSFDTYSHIRGQDTTAGASIKMAANISHSNLQHHAPVKRAKAMLQSANATHYGSKNFQGIEEIAADENSAMVKNERPDTGSHGRWSSDIHDETLTLVNSVRNEPATATNVMIEGAAATSGFLEQHRHLV